MNDTNELKKLSYQDLLLNNGEGGKPFWCMIHNKIYDLTEFKHPGGRDVLENDDEDKYTDKGKEFDSVGHPPTAIKEMEKYLIGELDKETKKIEKNKAKPVDPNSSKNESSDSGSGNGVSYAIFFFVLAGVALVLAYALGKI